MRRSFVSIPLSIAVSVASLAIAAPAGAYCRTTTAPVPANYDPTMHGCITEGSPLYWPSMPVTYELNVGASKQVTLDQALPIFEAAFDAWDQVSCSATDPTDHPSLSFQVLAPTDAGFTPCSDQTCEEAEADGPHQIIFRDDDWPYDDNANTIALTTVTFGADSGHIRASNMEINSHDHTISVVDPPPSNAISLSAIARHEAGHFVGLAHAQVDTAVMYAYYQPSVMSLTGDDIDGICAIYPPATPSTSSGCACSVGRDTSDRGSYAAVGAAIAFVAIAARRTRRLRP
jgi:MYXO-CTERM domain-containing protein